MLVVVQELVDLRNDRLLRRARCALLMLASNASLNVDASFGRSDEMLGHCSTVRLQ